MARYSDDAIYFLVRLILFYKNEFDSENPNKAVNVIAIIIKLFAFGGLFYISTIVPNTADEENLYIQVF